MDKLSKAIQVLEDQINYSVRNMDEVSVELDFESADVILELLKEQQPKEPMQIKYSETREEYWFYESICPKCGNRWISNGTDHFCPTCGQPVFEPCEEEQKYGEQE